MHKVPSINAIRKAVTFLEASPSILRNIVGIPERFLQARLTDFPASTNKTLLTAIINSQSIFISGDVGVGKSHMAAAVTKVAVAVRLIQEQKTTHLPIFIPATEMYSRHRLSIQEGNEWQFIRNFTSHPLITLDDISTEKLTEAKLELLYIVVNKIYNAGSQLIVTSNLNLNEISATYHDRIASRIAGMGIKIELGGSDRRVDHHKSNEQLLKGRKP